jgi:beta-galactosidase
VGPRRVFLLNHSPDLPATVALAGGTDLLTGATVTGEITLAPLGAAVVKRG